MNLNKRLLLFIILALPKTICSLKKAWVDSLSGESCKSMEHIHIQDHSSSAVNAMYTGSKSCPPWYWPVGNGTCQFGNDLGGIVKSNPHSMQTMLESFYCMTTNPLANKTVIGECVYSTVAGPLVPLPCNISELNDFMCADLNREGQLCGKCREGFAPPVYSYSLRCVNCTDYSLNWLKYLAVAFGPLTIFCTLLVVLHISPTSPYLHGYIFSSHLLGLPTIIRIVILTHEYHEFVQSAFVNPKLQHIIDCLFFTHVGIWNLDFFRLVYQLFCIHPKMTFLQVIALDYIIAAYPLVLVLFTYFLVSLYSCNCKLVVMLWKPFKCILAPYVRSFNVHTSLIDSFATLFLLSTLKFQSVTFDLLVPIQVYSMDGTHDHKPYLRLAGDVEYFGHEHIPYAILALSMFLTLVVLPTLLLFLYPCYYFQKCLNLCHCNSLTLRTFMDVFLGPYKDRTNSSKDFRYFAGIFFFFKTAIITVFAIIYSTSSFVLTGLILAFFSVSVALFQPHMSNTYNTLDALFLLHLSVGVIAMVKRLIIHSKHFFSLFNIAVVFTHLLYITGLSFYWVVLKKKIPQAFFKKLYFLYQEQKTSTSSALNEQTPLLLPQ